MSTYGPAQARYCVSAKGKAIATKWRNSPKGKAWRRKYESSPEYKAARTKERHTPKGRVNLRIRNMRKYGMSLESYSAMLKSQQGRCGSCRKLPGLKPLGIDHDHRTGRVRGLLCNNCNAGLGFLGDTLRSLQKAVRYMER